MEKRIGILSLLVLSLASMSQAAMIGVGSSDFEYGHNGNTGRVFSSADVFREEGTNYGYQGGHIMVYTGTARIYYGFEADAGSKISQVSLEANIYKTLGGTVNVFYTTAAYDANDPDGWADLSNWTDAGLAGAWPSTATFNPDSQTVYVAYDCVAGANSWDCDIRSDLLSFTVVPEPATMALLGVGGVAALIRRKK